MNTSFSIRSLKVSISMTTSGEPKISTPTAIGLTRTTTVGSGGPVHPQSVFTLTGRLTVTDIGRGVRPTVGRGSDMSHGDGRRITMAVGSITTIIGPGLRAACSLRGSAIGGDRRWSRSTSHSATTSAGIHCRITRGIRTQLTTVTMIVTKDRVMAMVGRAGGAQTTGTITITSRGVV